MVLVGLLALTIGGLASDTAPEALVAVAAQGIVGNQADVLVTKGCQQLIDRIKGQDATIDSVALKKALYQSYLQAQIEICVECQEELESQSSQRWRGRPVYSETTQSHANWLNSQLANLKSGLKLAESKDFEFPHISVRDLDGLMMSETKGQSITLAAAQLVTDSASPGNAIPLYLEKLNQQKSGLLDRAFGLFIRCLSQDSELRTFFEVRLLSQIDRKIDDVDANLKEVSEGVERLLFLAEQKQENPVYAISSAANDLLEPNPFVPVSGRIDSPDQFFGQTETLKWIFDTLNGGSSVALIGARESGKSSLLKAVEASAEQMLNTSRKPVYLNLGNVTDEEDFYYALCDNAGIPVCKGYKLRRELETKRLLLILDEIEKMTQDDFTNQIKGQLRSLAEGQHASLRLVIAASKPLDRLFVDSSHENMTSPLSGIFREKSLAVWTEAIIREFIAARLQTTSISFLEEDTLKIIQASQGKPKEVMKLCHEHYANVQRRLL